jgi:tetratricopeptide (TPR) repeat protein
MVRSTYDSLRKFFRSPTPRLAAALQSLRKTNLLLCVGGLLLGFVIGASIANSRIQSVSARRSPATPEKRGANLSTAPAKAGNDKQLMEDSAAAIQMAKNEPENFTAQLQAAEIYYQIQGYAQAIEFLERADRLRPHSDEVVLALGNINFLAGRYEEAERWFTAALDQRPDDVNIRTDLGMTFLFRQPPDFERAVKEFRRSLAIDPRHEPSLQNIIVALARQGDRAQAQEFLQQLEKINPQNATLNQLRLELSQRRTATVPTTEP